MDRSSSGNGNGNQFQLVRSTPRQGNRYFFSADYIDRLLSVRHIRNKNHTRYYGMRVFADAFFGNGSVDHLFRAGNLFPAVFILPEIVPETSCLCSAECCPLDCFSGHAHGLFCLAVACFCKCDSGHARDFFGSAGGVAIGSRSLSIRFTYKSNTMDQKGHFCLYHDFGDSRLFSGGSRFSEMILPKSYFSIISHWSSYSRNVLITVLILLDACRLRKIFSSVHCQKRFSSL